MCLQLRIVAGLRGEKQELLWPGLWKGGQYTVEKCSGMRSNLRELIESWTIHTVTGARVRESAGARFARDGGAACNGGSVVCWAGLPPAY